MNTDTHGNLAGTIFKCLEPTKLLVSLILCLSTPPPPYVKQDVTKSRALKLHSNDFRTSMNINLDFPLQVLRLWMFIGAVFRRDRFSRRTI